MYRRKGTIFGPQPLVARGAGADLPTDSSAVKRAMSISESSSAIAQHTRAGGCPTAC